MTELPGRSTIFGMRTLRTRYLLIGALAMAGTAGLVDGLSPASGAPQAVSAPMRTVLLGPVPAPPVVPVATTTTTTTTTTATVRAVGAASPSETAPPGVAAAQSSPAPSPPPAPASDQVAPTVTAPASSVPGPSSWQVAWIVRCPPAAGVWYTYVGSLAQAQEIYNQQSALIGQPASPGCFFGSVSEIEQVGTNGALAG